MQLLQVSIAQCSHVYVVIDGIDEGKEESREMSNILDQLCSLVTRCSHSSFLVLSWDAPSLRARIFVLPFCRAQRYMHSKYY
jgi:hypothetical protein